MSLLSRICFALGCCVLASVVLIGCEPSLPGFGASRDAGTQGALALTLEPAGSLDRAPPIVHLHLSAAGLSELDPASLCLVRGRMSAAQLKQLASSTPSASLADDIVPTIRWMDPATGTLVLAPTEALSAGEVYSIAGIEPPSIETLTIASMD